MTRRSFIGGAAAAAAALSVKGASVKPQEFRAVFLPWGRNMWGEALPKGVKSLKKGRLCNDRVKFDEAKWRQLVDHLILRKMNTVVIDVGEFPIYPSHPELAVKGSRSPDWVLKEVRRLKKLGLEVIPNYKACGDIIRDTAEMFDHPRFLHIGYDEERVSHQKGFACIRTDEVWWHDFLWFVKTVEKAGMRPWMWSDYGWHNEDFVSRCPKSVVHNNWYYDEWIEGFDLNAMKPKAPSRPLLELFVKLEKAGFDQVPCGSDWMSSKRSKANASNDACMAGLVKFCRKNIAPERLKGFLMAPWVGGYEGKNFVKATKKSIDLLDEALKV